MDLLGLFSFLQSFISIVQEVWFIISNLFDLQKI